MSYIEEFRSYVEQNYSDISMIERESNEFPDIDTGYILVKIGYNDAYHSLDMRFNGMADYESVFGEYIYPVLMKYRGFSLWRMGSARVIRVKVPCLNEELGFLEEDAEEQLNQVRTLLEIVEKVNVTGMYRKQRMKKSSQYLDEIGEMSEARGFLMDVNSALDRRVKEIEVCTSALGKSGIQTRLRHLSEDMEAFLEAHQTFLTKNANKDIVKDIFLKREELARLREEVK